ncbi:MULTISPECIES: hypothetical protein [Olivibacter]|uniref:Uncharacterized protein n=1 Tax=Olivibacter jilunii TaxID=985016 RepID=A0ABW6B0K4_9SPHI
MLWQGLNPITYRSIYESGNKSLSGIVRELGKEAGEIYVRAMLTVGIIELSEFFNIQQNMSEQQVVLTVNLIREKYWMLKPDDFKLCFKRIMMGGFGKVYGRLDGNVIMLWLDQYLDERTLWFEEYNMQDHRKIKDSEITAMEQRERDRSSEACHFSKYASDYITSKTKK